MVQKYINAASCRGDVITRSTAVSTAKTLIRRHPNLVGKIDLGKSGWAKNLLSTNGNHNQKSYFFKVDDTSASAKKEAELLFHHALVEKTKKRFIHYSIVINFDQTPSKFVPVASTTLAKRNTKQVYVKGSTTFTVTLEGRFLGMQLICGKTHQSLPNFKFPKKFSLSVNPKHYNNETKSIQFINEILVPYIQQKREKLNAPNQQALAIFDVFKIEATQAVLELFEEHNIVYTFVPANMTHLFQPPELTVNGYAKKYLKR